MIRWIFLEKYFDLNKKQCREGLDIYKKFLERTDKVSQFLKIAEVSKLWKLGDCIDGTFLSVLNNSFLDRSGEW